MKFYKFKKIKKWFIAAVMLLIPIFSMAQEESFDEDYLHRFLIEAAENNAELKALYHEYLAALEEIPQVGALPDPEMSFGYFIQPVETRVGAQRTMASVKQNFPWFGTLDAKEAVAAEKAKMKLHMFRLAKNELYRDVKILYSELYYLQEAIAITEKNLKLLESFKSIAEVYFESGKSGFTSILEVQMEEEELVNKLQLLKESQLPLITEFEQLLNTNLEQDLIFPEALWEEDLLLEKEEIFEKILTNNPYLIHLLHNINIEKYEVELAEKEGMPSFSLGLSYTAISEREDMNIADNGQDAFIFPQVGIKIPLFRKKYRAMEKQELLEKQAAEFVKENAEEELRTELEVIFKDYLDAKRKMALYKRLSEIAQQSLNLLQTELTTGKTDFFEIIRMQRKLLSYQLDLERAKTEKNNNVYRINYLMGANYEQEQ